jgi:hypothetical protein
MKKYTENNKISIKSNDKLFVSQEQEKGIEKYLNSLSVN